MTNGKRREKTAAGIGLAETDGPVGVPDPTGLSAGGCDLVKLFSA